MKTHLRPCRFRNLPRPDRTHTTLQLIASYFAAIAFFALGVSAHADPRPAWPPWPEPTLASYRFNDVDWHTPLLPPAIGFEDAYVQESWSEYGLIRDGFSMSPVIVPNVDASGRDTFAPEMGAVRFWFCPSWTSSLAGGEGPGEYARLLEAVDLAGSQLAVRWSLYMSEDGSALYLSGVGPNGRAKDLLTSPASFVAGQWELITLNYGPEECQLWVGDELLAAGDGMPNLRPGVEPIQGLVIGSDLAATTPAGGQFEEFTTFDYWIDAEQLAFYYSGVSRQVFRGTVGSAEEEAAKEEILAAMYPQPMVFKAQGDEMQTAYSYSTNELWLEIVGVSNGVANLVLHNTKPWTTYEILSKESLTNAGWLSETNVLAIEGQDWATADILTGDRTNSLFFRARSCVDDDGDGLPSWWELENGLDPSSPDTGDTGISDGYKDTDNDGWSNLQEYQNGTNPGGFDTPPAPQAVRARLNPTGPGALITWASSGSAVVDYVVERSGASYSTYDTSLVDSSFTMPTGRYYAEPEFRVQARYAGGNSTWSPWSALEESVNPVQTFLIPRGAGPSVLVVNAPLEADMIELWGFDSVEFGWTNVALPITLTNGSSEAPLPVWATDASRYVWLDHQLIRTGGVASVAESVLENSMPSPHAFADGRSQLADNLAFRLRAASISQWFDVFNDGGSEAEYYSQEDYVHSSYIENFWGYSGGSIEPWRPFEANYDLRNAAFSVSHLNSTNGWLTTGFDVWDSGFPPLFVVYSPAAFEFTDHGNYGAIPSVLSANNTQWLHPGWHPWDVGVTWVTPNFIMEENERNYYGLPLLSAQVVVAGETSGVASALLEAGGAIPDPNPSGDWLYIYPEAAQPVFENVGYYFGDRHMGPLPGHFDFYVTNATTMLLTTVGNDIDIAGYAKLAILNGYSNKFGYLGQYFDKAYKANPDGTPTTNKTGILSAYGEFFPTEPGPTVLTTLADGVSTNVGECLVHVVSLNVDANHDGVMDLSLSGPDQTSEDKPFVFWINNDFDRGHLVNCVPAPCVYEEDDIPASDPLAGCPAFPGQPTPDHDYQSIAGFYEIPCARDLEDYARLWLPGLTSLYAANTNLTFKLSIVSDGLNGDPAINIFKAADTNGGAIYLTDTNAANDQLFISTSAFARVQPGSPVTLNNFFLPTGDPSPFFIFCGAARGSGELVLSVLDGANLLAEASLYIHFKDIKEMYERWTLGDAPSMEPSDAAYLAADDLPVGFSPFKYTPAASNDIPYILHVHGWNMQPWIKDRFAETAFKRLYWQGYQGYFGSLRWPTDYDFDSLWDAVFDPQNFDRSEFNAWKSGGGLRALLQTLDTNYPGRVRLTAHSMGGIPAGQALRVSGAEPLLVHTYIAMQTALPSHTYDASATNRGLGLLDSFTPNRYAHYWNTTSPHYFVNVGGAGRHVNFFNASDFALASWELNQDLKPDNGYSFDVCCGSDPDGGLFRRLGFTPTELLWPADTFELFSFCVEARCYAVGAQQNVGGAFDVLRQVDLNVPPYNFGAAHVGHSGQFRSTNMKRASFWNKLLDETGLLP